MESLFDQALNELRDISILGSLAFFFDNLVFLIMSAKYWLLAQKLHSVLSGEFDPSIERRAKYLFYPQFVLILTACILLFCSNFPKVVQNLTLHKHLSNTAYAFNMIPGIIITAVMMVAMRKISKLDSSMVMISRRFIMYQLGAYLSQTLVQIVTFSVIIATNGAVI